LVPSILNPSDLGGQSMKALVLSIALIAPFTSAGQVRDPHAAQRFPRLASACVPIAPLSTVRAIVRAESNFYPYALSVNRPRRMGLRLRRQPRSQEEAVYWTRWLLEHHYTISAGLMQINSIDAAEHGVGAEQLFDPCRNLQLGWRILTEKYQSAAAKHGPGQQALLEALSLYNSGSPRLGFINGYVARLVLGEFPFRKP
jgi:type IV secretion system protein VirB1